MRPIDEIARTLGLPLDVLEPHGRYMAKVPPDATGPEQDSPMVVVTAMTPSPPGEGKTTTAIGLTQGLARIGRRPVLTLREPSIGPVFGSKGGGTGGGNARVMPDAEINLHFTHDAQAVAGAHNLLAALTDNAVHHETVPGFDASRVTWRRVSSVPDRALRNVVQGLGGRGHGPMRETGFDLDAASEVMAILALATGYEDLRARLGRIVVGYRRDDTPVTAADIGAVGPMLALLYDAIKPNLVQTLEGQPAFVHTGPFGNIAHGCNSILADRLALSYGDIAVTEAGFGAELGLEKFMDIKVRAGGPVPAAAVVVATVRAVKWHGGMELEHIDDYNMEALCKGAANLQHAIGVVHQFGLPAVVAINRFPRDRKEEIQAIRRAALDAGAVEAVESHAFAQGGEGARDLAGAVLGSLREPEEVRYAYALEDSIEAKLEALARHMYLAGSVRWQSKGMIRRFERLGWGGLPVCVAKTPLSISSDRKLRGRPTEHTFKVSDLRISAGAGFVYALAGDILTMPGLPARPGALDLDLTGDGRIAGVS